MREPEVIFRTLGLVCALGLAVSVGAGRNPAKKTIELPADNAMATLKPGVGVEVVRKNCMACHSTDYIVRQPGGDAARWQAEVEKMIKVFGAPVSESDAKAIAEYLATAYSRKAPSHEMPSTPVDNHR